MKYFILAGEASGDMHAANLITALKKEDTQAEFVGLGGDKMQEQGCMLLQHYRNMAFMGFVAVLNNLGKIKENFHIAEQGLLNEKPDVLILIDYPSFNLKVASFARKHLPQIKIIYYIPPKCWAWKKRRVHKIAQLCDEVLGIFPFEPDFYAQYGYRCTYVGNPTMDVIRSWEGANTQSSTTQHVPTLAILPGSRRSEISHCLPKMLAAARKVNQEISGKHFHIVVTAAPGVEDSFYASYLDGEELTRDTYNLLSRADAAIVNSGTATLEAAIIGCPQVAVYHIALGWAAGLIWKAVFTIRHFTLVNIIPNKEVIKEMIAYLFTVDNVATELKHLLTDIDYKRQMLDNYQQIRQILGATPAAENAARIICRSK